jgi:hypothetical protein
MAYIEFHDTVQDHPKTIALARLLKLPIPACVGHLACLWSRVIRLAPAGVISAVAVQQFAMYRGKRDFVQALIDSGFAHKTDDGIEMHDWQDYTRGYRKVASDIERRRSKNVARQSGDCSATVAQQSSDKSAITAGSGSERNRTERRRADGGPLDHLQTVARAQKIAGRPETVSQYVESWYARVGALKTEEMLMSSTGHSVMEIQERFFGKNGKAPPFAQLGIQKKSERQKKCETCKSTGSVVVQWDEDGQRREGVKPCPDCRKESINA